MKNGFIRQMCTSGNSFQQCLLSDLYVDCFTSKSTEWILGSCESVFAATNKTLYCPDEKVLVQFCYSPIQKDCNWNISKIFPADGYFDLIRDTKLSFSQSGVCCQLSTDLLSSTTVSSYYEYYSHYDDYGNRCKFVG